MNPFTVSRPLVSIICLCHNQASFVKEALESVWAQTYAAVELIVVDDGSADESVAVIESLLLDKPDILFLKLSENQGNCKAFNQALKFCKGKYVIDLAADDVLLPDRVAEGVKAMEAAGERYAVNFADAVYIDVDGVEIRRHYKRGGNGQLREKIPQGWVYADVLQRYFICTPTIMMRRSVLDALGGYDEALAYEDFDFWVRSARHWKYCFSNQVLVKKRVVPGSWSARQYERKSRQLESTLEVCRKAKELNKSLEEDKALARRLAYEIRQAIRNRVFDMAWQLLDLKKQLYFGALENTLYQAIIYCCSKRLGKRNG